MEYLFILNDAPCASERPYHALRLATSLTADGCNTVRLFLIGDGAWCAVAGRKPSEGAHDLEWTLNRFLAGGREAGVCRTCMEARGILPEALIPGTRRSTMDELHAWTAAADKVLVF